MTPETSEFGKWLASLGVGGAIAGLIFLFYRRDVRSYTELWKSMSDQLIAVVISNTESNTQLVEVVKSLHRRLDREEDAAGNHKGSRRPNNQ